MKVGHFAQEGIQNTAIIYCPWFKITLLSGPDSQGDLDE